jgi:hypothetical protein
MSQARTIVHTNSVPFGLVILVAVSLPSLSLAASGDLPFAVEVVDEATGRGVPLVELETINHVRFWTDSSGLIAIDDADLLGKTVWFAVRSHGYEFAKDGFGMQGKALQVERGGKATLKIKRINLAERLYRVTGSGIYRDSFLLGRKSPIANPLGAAGVVGCDSVMSAIYQGKCYWFWGDTSRSEYPLAANFHISGATTKLPQDGGLNPAVGMDFDYFVGSDNRVRAMAEMPGDGPTWISAVTVLREKDRERMLASYVKIRNQLESYQWGFVEWNDKAQSFEKVISFDVPPRVFLEPQTHTLLKREADGQEYVYFANPLPLTRVKADAKAFVDPTQYEGYTCLKAGTLPKDKQLDRGPDGKLRYAWKANTPKLTQKDQTLLVKAGLIKPEEALIALRDVKTGREVYAHSGSVYWNNYRKRWVLVTVELNGESSLLGEVWFAEADQSNGPWVYARKVATHDKYSFYNPKQHPFFDQEGGRTIFFEGTYTHTFSGNPVATPRYDYNQVMYRLDLSLPQLNLPVAFYGDGNSATLASGINSLDQTSVAFFALEHAGTKTLAMVKKQGRLQTRAQNDMSDPVFHALPADEEPSTTTTPLFEYVQRETGERRYSTDAEWSSAGYERTARPLCRVWKNPHAAR